MTLTTLLLTLKENPDEVTFEQSMDVIAQHYDYTPSRFINGSVTNEAGSNEGSCKIFAFALLNQLTQTQTLSCFGRYYREDVMQNLDGDNHGNIRNFLESGWEGVKFDNDVLCKK